VTGCSGPHGDDDLPDQAFAAALACLPAVGPAWLVTALGRYGPEGAWRRVARGELNMPPASARSAPARAARAEDWATWAARFDLGAFWRSCLQKGISVAWPGSTGYPEALARGAAPAGVLFLAGAVGAATATPAVAVVGTRECTSDGAAVAFEIGYELAQAGACVVSGLALGIDGAAHAGAVTALRGLGPANPEGNPPAPLRGTTVGVAASGVDVVYPPKHAVLWREVVRLGAVISETPPGYPAQSWRFPSRNRVIAGMAKMVVVVECHLKGGSWHTVNAALRNGTEVAAVPGSVRSPAADGTNQLIREGATPVRHAADILDAIGHAGPEPRPLEEARAGRHRHGRGPDGRGPDRLGPVEQHVLAALAGRPLCLDDLVERSGLPVTAVAVGLEHLRDQGLAHEEGGWWAKR
jgi:DNA processing protein